MKLILFTLLSFLVTLPCMAQMEFNVGFNGTRSTFRGAGSAVAISAYDLHLTNNGQNTVSNLYGRNAGIGWGLDFSAQRILKKDFIVGVSLGYESTNSRIFLINGSSGSSTMPDTGAAFHLVHGFANLYPYCGKRFRLNNQLIDINFGLELALPLSATVRAGGKKAFNHETPDLDLRPRLQVKWQYHQVGVLAAYSIGMYNYYGFLEGSKYQAYSNIGRLGFFYQLPSKKHS